MDVKNDRDDGEPQGARSHLARVFKRALVLFLVLAAGVLIIAIMTDGVPHLPFDYAGFD